VWKCCVCVCCVGPKTARSCVFQRNPPRPAFKTRSREHASVVRRKPGRNSGGEGGETRNVRRAEDATHRTGGPALRQSARAEEALHAGSGTVYSRGRPTIDKLASPFGTHAWIFVVFDDDFNTLVVAPSRYLVARKRMTRWLFCGWLSEQPCLEKGRAAAWIPKQCRKLVAIVMCLWRLGRPVTSRDLPR